MGLVVVLLLGAAAHADPPNPPAARSESGITEPGNSKTLPQVTIQAQREALRKKTSSFVEGITHGTRFYGESLGRWREPICFAVAGLPDRAGMFVLRRLRETATAAGAPLAQGRCRYNLYVVFDENPEKFLERLYRQHRRIFDQQDGLQAVKSFISPPRPKPVRVWQNPEYVGGDGVRPNSDGVAGGTTVAVGGQLVPALPTYNMSRMGFDATLGFSLVMVIVDMRQVNGYKLGQLADYCAMAGLADVNLEAHLDDANTVLRLFSALPEERPEGLTPWDQAFLHALYNTDQSSRVQRSQIATQMVRDITP